MKKLILLAVFLLFYSCAFASFISNGDIYSTDMVSIDDWADGDAKTGVSSQVTFDGQSCMKLNSGITAEPGTLASRSQDIGSFDARTVFSFKIYCQVGIRENNDAFAFLAYDGTTILNTRFASDGLFVFDGATWNEVGTDLVSVDTWQEWTFDVNWTAQTVDVYLDKVLKATGVDCSVASAVAEGTINFIQYGYITTNRITYIDWFKAGSNFISFTTLRNCTIRNAVIR